MLKTELHAVSEHTTHGEKVGNSMKSASDEITNVLHLEYCYLILAIYIELVLVSKKVYIRAS